MNRWSNKLMTLLRLLVMAMLFGVAAIVAPLATLANAPHTSNYLLQDDGDDEETPEDEDEETPEDEDEETPDDEDITPEDDEETPEDESELDPDWVDAGLISETEYESPQWGWTVEWEEPYILDTESDDEPVESETESTDDSAAFDRVWLMSEEPFSFTAVYGYSYEEYGYEDDEEATADWVDYWTSDDYLENPDLFGSDVAVLLDDSNEETGGVVIYDTDGDGVPYVRYKEVLISEDGESVIALDFSGYVDELEDSLTAAQTAIQVEGENVYLTFSVDDILEAVDDHESNSSGDDDEDVTPEDEEDTSDDDDAEETPDDEDEPEDEETPEDEEESGFFSRFSFSAPVESNR